MATASTIGESVVKDTLHQASFIPKYDSYRQWLTDRNFYCFHFTLLYILVVFGGQWLMKNRKPLSISKIILGWNLLLAVFSIVGSFGVFREFFVTLTRRGVFESYCRIGDEFYTGTNGYWVYLFHFSKLFELGDTVFLVLRKRPVIFLHWYHHATVLIYTWLTYPLNIGPTRWGVLMNYVIHAVMYSYYAAKSAHLRCPGWLAPSITTLQMSQFVVGLFACCHAFYTLHTHGAGSCDVTWWSSVTSIVLYMSYFVLFANFFRNSYLDKQKAANKKCVANGFTTSTNGFANHGDQISANGDRKTR